MCMMPRPPHSRSPGPAAVADAGVAVSAVWKNVAARASVLMRYMLFVDGVEC